MSNYSSAKDYVKKLKNYVNNNADFTIMQYKFVKVSKVDDLLACVLAAVPESYKKALKQRNRSLYRSIVAYNTLIKVLKKKFFLFPGYYVVDYGEAGQVFDVIIASIENDIFNIEELD